jgi:transcriptional regulator with XRE-family HTH domain
MKSSRAHLSKLELGERVATVSTLAAMAKALGVSVAAFVEGTPEPIAAPPQSKAQARLARLLRDEDDSFLAEVEGVVRALKRVRARGSRTQPS